MSLWGKLKVKHWDKVYDYSDDFSGAYTLISSPPLRRLVDWLRKVGIDKFLMRIGMLITIIGGIIGIFWATR